MTAKKDIAISLIKILIGSFIFSVSVNYFAISNGLGEGGVTGLTMLLYYLKQIPTAYTNLILNTVLMVVGWKFLDKKTIYYTLVAIGCMSFFLHLTVDWQFHTEQTTIAALGAGFLMGSGMGLIMNAGGTTAGSAILAKLANKYWGWNTSYALLFFDAIVVIVSAKTLGMEKLLFTLVSLYTSTKILDFILEGYNPKKAVTIISDESDMIAQHVDAQLQRGITVFHGHGYYMKKEKNILYIVVNRQQLMDLTKIVNKYDPKAFFIINDVSSVVGEGFTKQLTEED